jgi:hypothetical protein
MGRHWGLIHQYQGGHGAPVDCPPLDWWLFFFPGGIDWASPGRESVHALIGHVSRRPYVEELGLMLRAYSLAGSIAVAVKDASMVSRMGRIDAARYLNRIAAEYLEKQS